MTTEDLLKLRFKVIADFWNSCFKVGELLLYHFEGYLIGEESRIIIPEKDVKKYPHLFKKLEWYEERKIEDMPEFIRINQKTVCRVLRHFDFDSFFNKSAFIDAKTRYNYPYYTSVPATRSEYESQNKK